MIVVILALFAVAFVFIVYYQRPPQHSVENFQILGALAPVQKDLARCLSKCEKQNPSNRLGDANLPCDRYCYERYSSIGKCECNSPKKVTKSNCSDLCRGDLGCSTMCSCIQEVIDWCANMWCPSSKLGSEECIRQCVNANAVKCSSGRSWNWKL